MQKVKKVFTIGDLSSKFFFELSSGEVWERSFNLSLQVHQPRFAQQVENRWSCSFESNDFEIIIIPITIIIIIITINTINSIININDINIINKTTIWQ